VRARWDEPVSFGVDYAWRSGSLSAFIKALKAANVTFVCRYLSHSSGKNLTHDEAKALTAAGISIVCVWETTAERSLAGHAAGAQDAKDALAEAKACGMPDGRPIYFAVDFDASAGQEPAISTYLDGAASVLGKSGCGPYGGYAVVKHALDGDHCRWAWQTYAWSGGKWDTRAQLQQYSNDHVIGGVGLDYDRSQRSDFGQWRIGWTPNVTPTPDPTPQEDDMPSGMLNQEPSLPSGVRETPISVPPGKYKKIGFLADGGLLGLPPVTVRVAQHLNSVAWKVDHIIVDSTKAKVVLDVDPACDGLSVSYEDGGAVPVAWDMS
jgi:hypothetical protein